MGAVDVHHARHFDDVVVMKIWQRAVVRDVERDDGVRVEVHRADDAQRDLVVAGQRP